MKREQYFCDHCPKKLDEMKDYCGIVVRIGHQEANVDLCESCFEKLKAHIDDFFIRPQEDKP